MSSTDLAVSDDVQASPPIAQTVTFVWETEDFVDDSTPLPADAEDECESSDEEPTPEWFSQCCVADHIEDFKTEDLIKRKFSGHASVVANPVFLWHPGEEITYSFLPGPHSGTPNQREVVIQCMREWMRYANVIFRLIFNVQDSMLRIAFSPKDGNWSRLGTAALRVVKTAPTANFCEIPENVAPSPRQKGVVLHEIGHILGLKHEHQSPSVRGILTWIDKEVRSFFKKKCKWTETMTKEQILEVEDPALLTNYTHLDLKSIMMYPMPSLTNKNGVTIPINDSLSVYDKAFIVVHYPYLDGNPHSAEWGFIRALGELGVGDILLESVVELYKQKDWQKIRAKLPEWYFRGRATMNLKVIESIA